MNIVPVLVLKDQSEKCDCGQAPAAFKDKVGGFWCYRCMKKFPFCWREVFTKEALQYEIDLNKEVEEWVGES